MTSCSKVAPKDEVGLSEHSSRDAQNNVVQVGKKEYVAGSSSTADAGQDEVSDLRTCTLQTQQEAQGIAYWGKRVTLIPA
jgi:hypothetical protein